MPLALPRRRRDGLLLSPVWSKLHSVETIQVVLGTTLLRATDGAARRAGMNRSALIREALREYLKHLETRELEARDRAGYAKHPQDSTEAADWERVAAWPEQ